MTKPVDPAVKAVALELPTRYERFIDWLYLDVVDKFDYFLTRMTWKCRSWFPWWIVFILFAWFVFPWSLLRDQLDAHWIGLYERRYRRSEAVALPQFEI